MPNDITPRPGGPVLDDAHVSAYCRALTTDLPRGVLGCAVAVEVLGAIPEARRRCLPDVTGSAPEIFRALVSWGLLRSMPSARVMAASLVHLAAISPLVAQRSARQWTLHLSQLLDEVSAVAAAIQRRVSPALLGLAPDSPTTVGVRSSSIRAERDRLAAEIELANRRGQEAVQRGNAAEEQAQTAETRAFEAELLARAAEEKAAAAEVRAGEAERDALAARTEVSVADRRAAAAETEARAASRRADVAEEHAQAASLRAAEVDARRLTAEQQARAALARVAAVERQAAERASADAERAGLVASELKSTRAVARAHEQQAARLGHELQRTAGLLDECRRVMGRPDGPLHDAITAERETRAREVAQLQQAANDVRKEFQAYRATTSTILDASETGRQAVQKELDRARATILEISEKLEKVGDEARENALKLSSAMIEQRRKAALDNIHSTERETIREMLKVERFDHRVLVDVLRDHLAERADALREIEQVRQLFQMPSNDRRSLREVVEAVLRRR